MIKQNFRTAAHIYRLICAIALPSFLAYMLYDDYNLWSKAKYSEILVLLWVYFLYIVAYTAFFSICYWAIATLIILVHRRLTKTDSN